MALRLAQVIAEKTVILENAGIDQAQVEVELILCHLLDCDRLRLYLDGADLLNESILRGLDQVVERRVSRYPLQYLLGSTWFYGMRFRVTPAVMVPTPETEQLCELALEFLRMRQYSQPRLLDLGVGSGVISVTLARKDPSCSVVAVDISREALEVARLNAEDLGVVDRVKFRQSDFFSAILPDEEFDLIVSNPPYISENEYEHLPPEVKADPKPALLAGPEGLDAITTIIRQAPDYLSPRGRLMFEIGYRQAESVMALTSGDERYKSLVIRKDLNDIDRVAILGCSP